MTDCSLLCVGCAPQQGACNKMRMHAVLPARGTWPLWRLGKGAPSLRHNALPPPRLMLLLKQTPASLLCAPFPHAMAAGLAAQQRRPPASVATRCCPTLAHRQGLIVLCSNDFTANIADGFDAQVVRPLRFLAHAFLL